MKKILILLLLAVFVFAAPPAGYYDDANGLSGAALKAALHDIIDGHTEYSYSFLWTGLIYTDEDPADDSRFILLYSGVSLPNTAVYDDWNREHSWPKSHGDFGTSAPAGTDMHHLRPTNVQVNSTRGNKDYDNGGSLVSGTSDCYTDADSFEPRDEVKGDCARMMFYMATRYEGDAGGEPDLELVDYTGTSGPQLGKLSTLLAWHVQDPVDDWERRRNDRVASYQNNRNPFIDHPEYVSYIWGGETPSGIDAPVATAPTNVDSTSFTANWNAVVEADAYKLYVSEDAAFISYLSGYEPKTVTDLYEDITGLTPETNYYYKLKAYNSSEESVFSNVIEVLTLEGGGTVTPPDSGDVRVETFENYPETGSSYVNGSFTGIDGSTWTYDQCRGDILIESETPCLGKGRTPVASISSGTLSGGISTLSFQYKQAFSADVSLDVYVNDIKYATVTSNDEMGTIKESGSVEIGIHEEAILKFVQSTSESGQVAVDNVTWTSFPVSIDPIMPENFIVGNAYPNPFNPLCVLPVELKHDAYAKISLLDILGNERQVLHDGNLSSGRHKFTVDGSGLATGVYLLRIKNTHEIITQKVVLLK